MTRGFTEALRRAFDELKNTDGKPVTIKLTMAEDAIDLVKKLTLSDLQHA